MTPLQTATRKVRSNAHIYGISAQMVLQLTPSEVVALREEHGEQFVRAPGYMDIAYMVSIGESRPICCDVFPRRASTPFVFTKPFDGGTK